MSTPAAAPTHISSDQYPLLVSRRQAFDTLLWQTPVLSLTAQAFLFSISLSAGNSQGARVISAILALTTALASIQLMVKHRFHERRDSDLLQSFESAEGILEIHAHRALPQQPWYIRWSSYKIWLLTLWLFAVSAMVVLLSVLCNSRLL